MSQKKRFDASGAPLNAAARSWAARNPGRAAPVRFRAPAPMVLSTRSPGALLERTLTWLLGQVAPPDPPVAPAALAARPAEPARTQVPPSRPPNPSVPQWEARPGPFTCGPTARRAAWRDNGAAAAHLGADVGA